MVEQNDLQLEGTMFKRIALAALFASSALIGAPMSATAATAPGCALNCWAEYIYNDNDVIIDIIWHCSGVEMNCVE
jgi:hypothetical protein